MSRSKTEKKVRSAKIRARARRIKSYHKAVIRTSYNRYLFEERMKRGFSRRRFARALRIFPLFYKLMESGYLKPGARTRKKISAYCGENYQPYCEGISSYPEDLPEKPRLGITVWFFNVMGSLPFRLIMGLLIAGMLGCLIYGILAYRRFSSDSMADAPEALTALMAGIRENGSVTLSPSGSITRMEIYRMEGNAKFISVKVDSDDSFPYNVDFSAHHWLPEGRLSYLISLDINDPDIVSVTYSDYTSNRTHEADIDLRGQAPVLANMSSRAGTADDPEPSEEVRALMLSEVDSFLTDIEDLIRSELGLDIDFRQLWRDSSAACSQYDDSFFGSLAVMLAGGCLFLLLLFFLIYCLIYGTKNGVRREVMTNNNLIRYAMHAEPKTDLRLFPFLPETLLSLVGSSILFSSSMRLITYAAVFVGISDLDLSTAGTVNNQLMTYFYLGMFLLYFLDFDTFLDDMRVMGRIFLYLFLYLGLFALEYGVMSYLANSSSPLYNLAASFTPPNMFGTICLYFVIMLFLFFTPRFIRTRKHLILYRLCSLIPVLIIFGAHIISKSSADLFGQELPLALRLLLNEEKIAFSVLCVSYLFMLFFLRLFFERRYGTDNARKIFNGNRFIWLKNIMTCLLILFIVVLNMLMGRNAKALDFGWGQTTDLLLLTPLILFYHPHKGPRSRFVDALTMTYYLFALSFGYILAGVIVLLGGLI